ncbi:ATP-binding protein [Shigella flexneri]
MKWQLRRRKRLATPLVVRQSYVLGGRAMEIVYDEADLRRYFQTAVSVSNDAQCCWIISLMTQ